MSSKPSGSSNNICNRSSANQSYAENILGKLCNFFDSKQLCDVVLIAGNDGKRIPAHRLVLSAASEYFAAMFVGSYREAFEEEIPIPEVNGDVLEILVKHCYTGLLECSRDLMEDLLSTANLLQISTAVMECGDYFITQLDSTNSLGFTIFAERHNCQSLLKSATEYTCSHFMEVYQNDEFKQLNDDELKKLLLSDNLNVPSEEYVFNALKLWVEHDLDNRKKHIPNLLHSIRLHLLAPLFLAENVENFCDSDECIKPIKEAFKYHCLTNQNSKICRSKRRLGNNFSLLGVSWESDNTSINIQSYSPRKNTWSVLGNLPINMCYFEMDILDDKLFIVGGHGYSGALNSLQCLDLNKMMLTPVNSMQNCRNGPAVAILKGSLYAIGGIDDAYNALNTVEKWDPSTQVWNYVASMNSGRVHASAAVLNEKIYVCGGYSSEDLNTVECYDPITNVWTLKASMNKKRRRFGAAALNEYLYVVGGIESDGSVECYEPISDVWTSIASLKFDAYSCAVLENSLIAVGVINAAEYNPEKTQWETLSDSSNQLDKILCVPDHILPTPKV